MTCRVLTLAKNPGFREDIDRLNAEIWPSFMLHDAVANLYWNKLYADFPQFQFVLCDKGDEVVAAGNCIPLVWDGDSESLPEGWDSVLEKGFMDLQEGREPTAMSALLAIVSHDGKRRGISIKVLEVMKTIAMKQRLEFLIAPVRPTLKSQYPLTPMESYVRWKREDGLPFDPWLRVHRRLGAEFLRVAHRSMLITGTVKEWEDWTGMRFLQSGSYVVPGALQPVTMDLEKDLGVYEEPNVWMRHPVPGGG